jgi:dienelactone hydrolase
MRPSRRLVTIAAATVVAATASAFWVVHRLSQVDDPATAECAQPAVTFGQVRAREDHREVEITFRCEGARLAGTLYLPETPGPHPAVVWVHGAGEAPRLGWGGQILPGLVHTGVAVLSYDKRGVGQSDGVCCPGDTGHFNLLTADVVGAVHVLRQRAEVDPRRVGLAGASQAGWIAPRAAIDSDAAFVALAGAPTVPERIANLYERLEAGQEGDLSRAEIARRLKESDSKGFDPMRYLAAMTMPGLWEFGTADEHTPVTESVAILDKLKTSGHDFTVVTFAGAGHGLLDVPPSDPDAAPMMIRWIKRQVD